MTGRAVEEHEQRREEEQQRDEQREQLIEKAPAPIGPESAPSAAPNGALGDRGLGHQNACPSETVTATGPSPFWRLSGTPTSIRIGPKSE